MGSGTDVIFTDDVSLQIFFEHLQRLAVQSSWSGKKRRGFIVASFCETLVSYHRLLSSLNRIFFPHHIMRLETDLSGCWGQYKNIFLFPGSWGYFALKQGGCLWIPLCCMEKAILLPQVGLNLEGSSFDFLCFVSCQISVKNRVPILYWYFEDMQVK